MRGWKKEVSPVPEDTEGEIAEQGDGKRREPFSSLLCSADWGVGRDDDPL